MSAYSNDVMHPVHPGEILLEEFLKPFALTQAQLATATGMSLSRVRAIVAGRCSITWDTALRLATFFSNSPEFWLNCQNTYELDMAVFSGRRAQICGGIYPISFRHDTAYILKELQTV